MLKRITSWLSYLLIALMLLMGSAIQVFAQTTLAYGDADASGKVDLIDAMMVKKFIIKKISAFSTQDQAKAADVNGDSVVNTLDYLLIKQFIMGKISKFPADDNTSKKLIALTFDDGPSETTTLVLDKLEKYNVVASFFLIGQNITNDKKPIMERQLSLGCEIDNHSWTHSYMNTLTSDQIADEIKKTSDTIYEMVGVRPKFFRPPYIAVNNTMYTAIDIHFICGLSCTDWETSVTAQARAETILNNAKDGDIILLHDLSGNTQTVDALDSIINGLRDKGFTFVTVSQLFEKKGVNPNVEYRLWSNVTN